MNSDEKAIARLIFNNRVVKSNGQAFEDLFTQIMSYYNQNFEPVKPHGNDGDRKNDGFDKVNGVYYQVFAPEDINDKKTQNDAIKKIKRDFSGLYEKWNHLYEIKEFYFVINDKYAGVYPVTHATLTEIEKNFGLKKCGPFLPKDLENILFSLSDDVIKNIIGFIPDPASINKKIIDYSVVSQVIQHILLQKQDLLKPVINDAPKFDEKIDFNELKGYPEILLIKAGYQVGMLDKYFENNDPIIKIEIRDSLHAKYIELLKYEYNTTENNKNTMIFWDLIKFVTNDMNEQSYFDAALVILAKYFDTCDVFEDPSRIEEPLC